MSDTMLAAVLHKAGDLRYQSAPIPAKGDDDVIIKIHMNGICGSDVHFFEDGKLGPFVVTEPYIPGHEACGTVIEGPDTLKGRRVAIEPGIPCRRCDLCKTGRYNLCESVRFLSAPPENGTFAEYVSIPWDFAHVLPDTVDDENGAFVEPISVAVQACERAALSAGASVAIVGAGPIGQILALVARSYGASTIYVTDVIESRLEIAKAIGATAVFNAKDSDVREEIHRMSGGVDVVFDASGSSRAAASTPALASRGGVIVFVGWPELSTFEFPVELILEKELDIRGVNRYCNTYPKAISLLAAGLLDPKPLISHRYKIDQVVSAFELASGSKESTMKVLVSTD